ncbi:CBS domain-containing protein [Actinoplanes auranticolor]|uniref:BON domain-containing protein n=1 Tax=Actinoplanes auranticolor TaxID=47988 RepID=A0A919S6X7_9ACTN|nr:CBS domain-containing protein [Actinoplanes auranticolor]GIM65121.1 hypothetical protein Aau02nite_14880 [Actinoplanes auranticolor]
MQWQVDDVMTREVITVGADTPVGQIAGLLDREGISAVPVTAATGGVLGVVSQGDLLAGVAGGKRRRRRRRRPTGATAARAADVMTAPALCIDADASLTRAAQTMKSRNVRRLLVTGPQGRLLGVVSRGDLLRPYARPDAAIRREIEAVLRRRLWIGPEQIVVSVSEGAATLTGTVDRRSTADIATRLAAAVPGVTDVADRIVHDFDDAELARSTVGRTHPFSAEPFHPAGD